MRQSLTYTQLSGATFFEALIGQWLSPSRGLFVFSPILLLAIGGVVLKIRRQQWQPLDTLLISIIGLHWIVISLWCNWWVGVSFGPRIWSDMLPYLVYFIIPALATRRMETYVELVEGQSFVIAGLLDDRLTENLSKIPGLAQIPLFGSLFKSKSDKRTKTELVVIVTPSITDPVEAARRMPEPIMPKEFLPPAAVKPKDGK